MTPVPAGSGGGWRISRVGGSGFHAHRLIDPIFSFGLLAAMAEAGFAADAAMGYLEGPLRDKANPFRDYMIRVERGLDILEDVLDPFWENPLAFALLVHNRFREPLIDVLAGRIFDGMPNRGLDEALGVRPQPRRPGSLPAPSHRLTAARAPA
jgi:hypothetical protein